MSLAATQPQPNQQLCAGKIAHPCPEEMSETIVSSFTCGATSLLQLSDQIGTHVPTRNEGIRPAAACLKIVTLDTERS